MKTHVLIVSRTFPKTHKRAGEATNFPELIQKTLGLMNSGIFSDRTKIHTIRGNYELWDKRIKEVKEGKAILSLRYWLGKPYNSKQFEFCQLDKDSVIGIQKLFFKENNLLGEIAISPDIDIFHSYTISYISENDGLSFTDFKEWFKGYDLSKPMAIIHFTDFGY